MSLLKLPAELQDEILFRIVLQESGLSHIDEGIICWNIIDDVIRASIIPYILANRCALGCWRASKNVILHRVAKIHLAATQDRRRALRRGLVLARLRSRVWWATIVANDYHTMDGIYWRSMEADGWLDMFEAMWLPQARFVEYWWRFLLS
jgi:hypothetical protein